LRQKKDSLAERRHEHLFNFVIPAYFNRLLYDLTLWTANKAIPPAYLIAYGGLAEWPDIRNLSKEAREYFEKYKLEIDQAPKHKSKTKKPTAAERKQAAIWREVQIYIKTSKVAPGAKECIAELKKKPAYKDSRITRQQISKILEKGYNGDYDEILKRL
jgi:beta-phosphoglucomutase-like phosphatase (HAD superfamily)